MKCHLNRMTAALLLAVVMLTLPALAVQAAPASELHAADGSVGGDFVSDLHGLWQRLLDGLSAVFAGDGTQGDPDDDGDVTGGFDPDGFTWVPLDDGNETDVTGGFDPDG